MYKVVLFVLLSMNVISVKTQDKCSGGDYCECGVYTPNRNYCYQERRVVTCSNNLSTIDEISNPRYGDNNCAGLLIKDSNISIISSKTLSLYRSIGMLDINHNYIQEILPEAFNGMDSLHTLNISNNEVSAIRRGIFNRLQGLRTLRLDENKITEIEPHSFLGCSNLAEVHLDHNNISMLPQDIFDGITELSYLNLSANNFEYFKFFKGMKIIVLDLSNNHIERLEDWQLSYIAILSLSNNNLQEMLEIRAENRELFLDHNNITSLNCSGSTHIKSLSVLDLSYNSIRFISHDYFFSLSILETLKLQHNQIDKFDIDLFKSLSQLTYLDLSSNQITNFQRGTFAGLHNLQILNISSNRLVEIHYDFSLRKLQKLYFDDNRIFSLDVAAIHQQSKVLQEISLNNNQWNCKELMQMCFELTNFGINVLKGNSFNVENVYGIACQEEPNGNSKNSASNQEAIDQVMSGISGKFKATLNTAFENSDFFKYFQADYKRSNFFKYLDSYKFVVEHPEINENASEKTGFSALHLTPVPEEKDQKIVTLSLVGQFGIICCLSILIYFKLQKYKKRQIQTSDVENLNSISQIELCEQ